MMWQILNVLSEASPYLPFQSSGVPTIHDKGPVDVNSSFSYGSLVNNDGMAPALPVNTIQSPPSNRSTQASDGPSDIKED